MWNFKQRFVNLSNKGLRRVEKEVEVVGIIIPDTTPNILSSHTISAEW